MNVRKYQLYICLFLLAVCPELRAQNDTLYGRSAIFVYGGLGTQNSTNDVFAQKGLRIELQAGIEYLFFKPFSLGIDFNYNLPGFSFDNDMLYGDLCTTVKFNVYSKKLYYLKLAYSVLRDRNQHYAYPDSFIEHRYTVGFGKRYLLLDNISLHAEILVSRMNSEGINGDGILHTSYGIVMSLNAGVQIYLDLTKINKQNSD